MLRYPRGGGCGGGDGADHRPPAGAGEAGRGVMSAKPVARVARRSAARARSSVLRKASPRLRPSGIGDLVEGRWRRKGGHSGEATGTITYVVADGLRTPCYRKGMSAATSARRSAGPLGRCLDAESLAASSSCASPRLATANRYACRAGQRGRAHRRRAGEYEALITPQTSSQSSSSRLAGTLSSN